MSSDQDHLTDEEYMELLGKGLRYDDTTPLLGVVLAVVISFAFFAMVFGGYCLFTGRCLEAKYSDAVK